MYIYKITNIDNNKSYIGQTTRPIEQRFHRHILDAINGKLNTHFARAIRKYGPDKWVLETIDTANTQNELNQKEQYWIRYYNTIQEGYNETDALYKSGGNTYQSKTAEEMEIIKEKIRQSKIGAKNPMARKINRINIITGEIDTFDTIISCAQACGIQHGKTSIMTRLKGQVSTPFKKIWLFEYCDE